MRAVLAIGVCGLMLAAGCGNSGPRLIEQDGVRLVVAGKTDFAMMARIVGKVALTNGNCVGLEFGDKSKVVVAWPHGTKLAADGGVDLPGLGVVRLGEPITGGGGEVPYEVETSKLAIPENCVPKDRKYTVLNREDLSRGMG